MANKYKKGFVKSYYERKQEQENENRIKDKTLPPCRQSPKDSTIVRLSLFGSRTNRPSEPHT